MVMGKAMRIVTQHELEERLHSGSLDPARSQRGRHDPVRGFRENKRNYCSRICCASALKNALYLKEKNPDVNVTIFYRDMMSYGFLESYYTQARKAGVIFIQYDADEKPEVSMENGHPCSGRWITSWTENIQISADLLVLSTGIVPSENRKLAETLGSG